MSDLLLDDPFPDGTQPLAAEKLFDDPLAGLVTGETFERADDRWVSVGASSTVDVPKPVRLEPSAMTPTTGAHFDPHTGAPLTAPPSGQPYASMPSPAGAPVFASAPTGTPMAQPHPMPQGHAIPLPHGGRIVAPPPSRPAAPPAGRPARGRPSSGGAKSGGRTIIGCLGTLAILVIIIVRAISSLIDSFH